MSVDPKVVEVIKKYETEINDNNFVALIADVYVHSGVKGVGVLKDVLSKSNLNMQAYNKAIEKIIKDLLKNSDLLDENE